MRTLIIISLLLLPFTASAALTDSLQAYWDMEETSGTRYDSTANNNDLTDNNTVGYGTGKVGTNAAFFVRANSEYLSITDASQTGLDVATDDDFSISFWYKATAWNTANQYQIAGKDGGDGNRSYYMNFTYWDGGGGATWNACIGASSNGFNATTNCDWWKLGITPSAGTWYHFVLTFNNGVTTCYVNGSACAGNIGDYAPTGVYDSTAAFTMGYTAGTSYIDGYIDEFGFWSRVLTSSEASELYNSGSGLAYPFTGGGGSTPASQESDLIFFMYAPLPDRAFARYA